MYQRPPPQCSPIRLQAPRCWPIIRDLRTFESRCTALKERNAAGIRWPINWMVRGPSSCAFRAAPNLNSRASRRGRFEILQCLRPNLRKSSTRSHRSLRNAATERQRRRLSAPNSHRAFRVNTATTIITAATMAAAVSTECHAFQIRCAIRAMADRIANQIRKQIEQEPAQPTSLPRYFPLSLS